MKAKVQSQRITPKKLNLIAQLVRNKDASEALDMLEFLPKKGAKILHKAVKSAVANAKTNFKQDEDGLYIKEIVVNKATTMKRWHPVSRGRAHPILKRNSHVKVTVAVKESKAKAPAKTAAKPAETAKAAPKKAAPAAKTKKAAPKSTKKS